MSVLAVAKAARALISHPNRWSRGASARDINNRAVSPIDASAIRWDIGGAVNAIATAEYEHSQNIVSEVRCVAMDLFNLHLAVTNDRCATHSEMLEKFDKIIKYLADKEISKVTNKRGTFWLVWNLKGDNPKRAHSTEETANAEAERLAKIHVGARFFVMESTSMYVCEDVKRYDLRPISSTET